MKISERHIMEGDKCIPLMYQGTRLGMKGSVLGVCRPYKTEVKTGKLKNNVSSGGYVIITEIKCEEEKKMYEKEN